MSQQPIKITNATDLLDVLPALLGFYPTESLCVLVLDADGRKVALTARVDLPTTPDSLTGADEMLATFLQRYGHLALVAYSADYDAAHTTVRHLVRRLDPTRVTTALVAAPRGWTHIDPETPDTVQWTNPYPTSTGTAAAAAAAAGLAAYGTRDDLRDSIAAPDPTSAEAFQHAYTAEHVPADPTAAQVAAMAQEVVEQIRGYLAQPSTVTSEDAAYLAARVQNLHVRDTAWSLMDRATGRVHADLWRGVAALTPDTEEVLPVLGLLGMAGWIGGDGALANVALERVEQVPGGAAYSMLRLLQEVVEKAVPPTMWDQMVADLRRIL